MIKVSCVLPVYNEEKVISNCINSLLNQNYKNFEIIVVDDGSTDETVNLVNNYVKNNKNVRLFNQSHNGPGSARNFGAKHAKGKVLVFPDADEEFPVNYVSDLVRPIIKDSVIGTTTKVVKLNPNSNIFSKLKYLEFSRKFNYSNNLGSNVFRAITKKDFFRVNGFDNSTDYFDDGSLSKKLKTKPRLTNAFSYTTMSSTPKEIIFDSAWGVKSNIISGNKKPLVFFIVLIIFYAVVLFSIIFLPLLIILWYFVFGLWGYYLTKIKLSFIYYPMFFLFKSIGLFYGVFQSIFLKNKKGR